MTAMNAETNLSRYYGVEQMVQLAGVPYDSTSDLTTALNYPVVITASRILQDAFSASERLQIENFVNNGGVWITSNLRDTNFKNLAGVDQILSDNERYEIIWDTTANPVYFEMIDDSMEVTISLGRASSGPTFYTRGFITTSGVSLGDYEDGSSALVHNTFGSGHVYTFGPDFRDLNYRPRINQDVNAHRSYSNGFEPSSDVVMMVFRNIVSQHISNSVYKYPVPGKFSSVLCLTHDVDSRTAVDTMAAFVDAEVNRGIKAHYNVTVRYLSDGWMTNFYVGSHQPIAYVRDQGHTLASHSVGHFPDFEDESVFPYGAMGNDAANYQPVYFSGMTIGGSVLGETEVSKELLEADFNVPVRSWRSGHLAFPDSLIMALEELGYEFNSTYSANNILTNFPYYGIHDGSFSGHPSSVLEIPMTISDVFSSDPIDENNYMDKVGIWSDVNRRYDRNNSSVTLLIHPNRGWKLIAQEAFLDSLPAEQGVVAFEEYGEFWRKRDSLEYTTELIGGGSEMEVHCFSDLALGQSFVVDTNGLTDVSFYDQFGVEVVFSSQPFAGSKLLFYQEAYVNAQVSEEDDVQVVVFPNPTDGLVYIQSSALSVSRVEVFTLSGQKIIDKQGSPTLKQTIQFPASIAEGVYLLKIQMGEEVLFKKLVLNK
jgi:hypothetical protein